MRSTILICILSFTFSCANDNNEIESGTIESKDSMSIETDQVLTEIDSSLIQIVGLPCPNSSTRVGKWTYSEAESHKHEIFDMQLSHKYWAWKNPTTGGAVHINEKDEIEVYQFTMNCMYMGKGTDENGDTVVFVRQVPEDTSIVVESKDLLHHVGGVGFGNETSVLITSEYNLSESESIKEVMDELFKPGIQLYYISKP